MASGDSNENHLGVTDENGDLDANGPNPVNANPQFNGDYPEPKPTTSKIPEIGPSTVAATESPAINRPPKPPGPALGPYFQFISTDLDKMLWLGSALIFRHISFDRPKIEFICEAHVDYSWEVLYDNLFDMQAFRINLSIELRDGEGDDEVIWKVDWGDDWSEGLFRIARYNQKWRGGFFSCNGFDAYVPEKVASDLTYSNVWNHLDSVHDETPLHLLIWGGDQNYIDFLFEDVPFLRAWLKMEWNAKWTCDYRNDLKEQVEQYHFNTYAENWERRPEVKKALSSIPSVMQWDDHDIFDGAGSYPPLLHDSPMMMGLFEAAQKMRLLFQHHTTADKARQHGLFGHKGHNFIARCGPHLVLLGTDGRTERDAETVQHEKTWDMMFEKLDTELVNVQHLIVLLPVPFSFVRFRLAESIFERLKNLPNKWRKVSPVKQTNSIFGLPELYDDLLDEWTHSSHIAERNRALLRFQDMADRMKVRITFFSGDVHCCAIGRFRSRGRNPPPAINDPKLMYQIISSAIVNLGPSRRSLQVAHFFKTRWSPFNNTEEEIIDFFERAPENGKKLLLKKMLPNRNWCYFEQCAHSESVVAGIVQTARLHRCFPSKDNVILPVTLGPTSDQHGHGGTKPPIHQHSHGSHCHQMPPETIEHGSNNFKIRLWLESSEKHEQGRQFVSYDLLIPNLK